MPGVIRPRAEARRRTRAQTGAATCPPHHQARVDFSVAWWRCARARSMSLRPKTPRASRAN